LLFYHKQKYPVSKLNKGLCTIIKRGTVNMTHASETAVYQQFNPIADLPYDYSVEVEYYRTFGTGERQVRVISYINYFGFENSKPERIFEFINYKNGERFFTYDKKIFKFAKDEALGYYFQEKYFSKDKDEVSEILKGVGIE
jgi:hypothetical protein